MRFSELYARSRPVISFEIFPPRTEKQVAELDSRLQGLVDLRPSFISVTYGALGSTRDRTLEIVTRIKREFQMEAAHHLTCVGLRRNEITEALRVIRSRGIENIVALRGDPPRGEMAFVPPEGGLRYGREMVEHVKAFGGFGIAVAGYPETHVEARDGDSDLRHLKEKADAGADVVITQLFYDNSHYYRFVERCRAAGMTQPIVPGLLPILNVEQIKRITAVCGATIPPTLMRRLMDTGEDQAQVHTVGIEHTTGQALDLLRHGVPGIHFYVLNQNFHIKEIMGNIRGALGTQMATDR